MPIAVPDTSPVRTELKGVTPGPGGAAFNVTLNVCGTLTVNINDAVRIVRPAVALTIIIYVPGGVEESVFTVIIVEHVGFGLHEGKENDAVAPEGNPVTLTPGALIAAFRI